MDVEDHSTCVIYFYGLIIHGGIIYQLSHCFGHGLCAVVLFYFDDLQCH